MNDESKAGEIRLLPDSGNIPDGFVLADGEKIACPCPEPRADEERQGLP